MTKRLPSLLQATGLLLLGCCCASLPAHAQDDAPEMKLSDQPAKGMYVTLPPRLRYDLAPTLSAPLASWNGSFTYNGRNYTYNMVGSAPSSNTSTTVTTYIVPVKLVIRTTHTFDPAHVLSNGNTVTNNTIASPVFDATTTYVQGGVNVGTSQYIDAYQRANFWGTVQSHPNSHLLLSNPIVLAEQTLRPSSRYGTTGAPFGFTVGLVDINYFDAQLQTIISSFPQIQPNDLVIFITYDVYLTQGGSCCIGGYHSSEGSISNPQAYAHFTYIDHSGTFAQDVSALSHEIGEWADDPLTVNPNGNNTPCGILENGDPLEGDANYGDYAYTLHGFTYHLQDLATLPYFGAPPSTSVNNYFTFQGTRLSVCQNGS